MSILYWNTVAPILKNVLQDIITEQIFEPFRLVGGTSLSLQLGHRMSVDIDLFTDAEYGSIDYKAIREFFELKYHYCTSRNLDNVAFGTYFEVGNSKNDFVKVDLYYTDEFIEPPIIIDNIRMATVSEIIAMKLEVLSQGGRKKDFWDLHYFIDKVNVDDMISLHEKRYPYTDNFNKKQFVSFGKAEEDLEPICLLEKDWEIMKLDFNEFIIK
jgi:predicted nucleotidyltransferase component of viral defense system